jgi:hypothetical protein
MDVILLFAIHVIYVRFGFFLSPLFSFLALGELYLG